MIGDDGFQVIGRRGGDRRGSQQQCDKKAMAPAEFHDDDVPPITMLAA
jgi:hypothetical protein